MDIWTQKKRSQVMLRILSRNTKPEQRVRKMLSSLGVRYRLNVQTLPGKPDVVLRKRNAIIFVHGCFWHLHSRCRDGTAPKSRVKYWEQKLLNNKRRDAKHMRSLRQAGWKVLRLWECELEKKPQKALERLTEFTKT